MSSGLETVKCLVSCKGDVNTFLAQSELLDLCEKVLRVSALFTIYPKIFSGGISKLKQQICIAFDLWTRSRDQRGTCMYMYNNIWDD